MIAPTAADLYRANFCVCGDHELALDEALATVDRERRSMRSLLGVATDDA